MPSPVNSLRFVMESPVIQICPRCYSFAMGIRFAFVFNILCRLVERHRYLIAQTLIIMSTFQSNEVLCIFYSAQCLHFFSRDTVHGSTTIVVLINKYRARIPTRLEYSLPPHFFLFSMRKTLLFVHIIRQFRL